MTLLTIEQFRKEARANRTPTGGIFRVHVGKPKSLEDGSRRVRFCFSDGAVDRMRDTIDPHGWDLTEFNRNPVALWAHDSSAPPIGRADDVGLEGERLMGNIDFAPPETYAFADTIYRLVVGRFINAVSVGFIPLEWEWSKDDDREWGMDFLKQSLLEISVCPIPANPNALGEARAKGIDTRPLVEWAERTLEGGGKLLVTRAELERLRKAAKEPPVKRRTPGKPRAGGATEENPDAGGATVGNCGRGVDDQCGMTDPDECSVHGSGKTTDNEEDDEKALRRLLRRLLGPRRRADDTDPGDDDLPLAHEDAIRVAHKCMRTVKALMTEAVSHHAKALSLLDDVVDALNDDSDPGDPPNPDDDPDGEKAAQLARARALRRKHPKH